MNAYQARQALKNVRTFCGELTQSQATQVRKMVAYQRNLGGYNLDDYKIIKDAQGNLKGRQHMVVWAREGGKIEELFATAK